MKNLYKIEDELYVVSNNEDISENCWIITNGKLVQVSYLLSDEVAKGFKVILTTNKLLIKDGVQAINDDFLEWFVKNPTCEAIMVTKVEHLTNTPYRIFFPKERQKSLVEKMKPSQEQWQKEMDNALNTKQETLKEAAQKFYPPTTTDFICSPKLVRDGFIAGAKWQMNKQDEFTLGFLHWYNTSQECETYLRRNYPKNITMNGEHYKKVLQINKELLEMYKNTLPR